MSRRRRKLPTPEPCITTSKMYHRPIIQSQVRHEHKEVIKHTCLHQFEHQLDQAHRVFVHLQITCMERERPTHVKLNRRSLARRYHKQICLNGSIGYPPPGTFT